MDTLKNFVNKRFKRFMDSIHIVKETTPAVEEKPLCLSPSIALFNILTN